MAEPVAGSAAPPGSALTYDVGRVLAGRALRTCAHGFAGVALAIYLSQLGLDDVEIGVVLGAALFGSAVWTGVFAVIADRVGRRRLLVGTSLAMVAAYLAFAVGGPVWLLVVAALSGTLSATGTEVGPFVALEQAMLGQLEGGSGRAHLFAWYNAAGSVAAASGALLAGAPAALLSLQGVDATRPLFLLGALFALVGALLALALSPAVEALDRRPDIARLGLHRSRRVVFELCALFAVDSLAGGFIVQSLISYYFHRRFGVGLEDLGPLFSLTALANAGSFLVAARVAERVGLLRTMVFSHLISNGLLILVPLASQFPIGAGLLILRETTSQMDVPTRQAYTMALVDSEERAAAAGLTNLARSLARAIAPPLAGLALGSSLLGLPFFLAGGLKASYDLALWARFRRVPLPRRS